MQVVYRQKSRFWSNSWPSKIDGLKWLNVFHKYVDIEAVACVHNLQYRSVQVDVRSAKNIYRRRSWVYDTVGHAPLAIDRLLDVRTTKWQKQLRPRSIIPASCKPGCKPGFRRGLQPGFWQVHAGLGHLSTCFRHSFDFFVENLVANLLHQSWHVEIDAAQMECRKKPFRASQQTCWSWIFVTYFIIRANHDVNKWKNAMKKFDFTPKNVINCVDNEPALWDTEFTDVHPEITARINSYHWLLFSGRIVLYASCLSLIYCLTHVECFRFFYLAAIIAAPKLHTTTAVHATTISSSSSILRKIGRIYRSHTCGRH